MGKYEVCWPLGMVPTGRAPHQLTKSPFKYLNVDLCNVYWWDDFVQLIIFNQHQICIPVNEKYKWFLNLYREGGFSKQMAKFPIGQMGGVLQLSSKRERRANFFPRLDLAYILCYYNITTRTRRGLFLLYILLQLLHMFFVKVLEKDPSPLKNSISHKRNVNK